MVGKHIHFEHVFFNFKRQLILSGRTFDDGVVVGEGEAEI